jgi:hypothetical protein
VPADYPAEHFPGTPTWWQAAVADAIARSGVAPKWQVPLECMGRYESNYRPGANVCDPDTTKPVGIMQVGRFMVVDARKRYPELFAGLGGVEDPVRQALVAILHIDSKLSVTGGYGGIGQPYGSVGLLPREDRGPGNVLRAWIDDPNGFDVEDARPLYRGY